MNTTSCCAVDAWIYWWPTKLQEPYVQVRDTCHLGCDDSNHCLYKTLLLVGKWYCDVCLALNIMHATTIDWATMTYSRTWRDTCFARSPAIFCCQVLYFMFISLRTCLMQDPATFEQFLGHNNLFYFCQMNYLLPWLVPKSALGKTQSELINTKNEL